MTDERAPIHYVCTHEEAWRLVTEHRSFWISNCGCREERGGCSRSRIDVCLMFDDLPPSGSGKRKATAGDVAEIFREARSAHLVTRPFRSEDRTTVEGVCFCCDDCCGYFLDPAEKCDRGAQIERTEMSACTHCGACEEACYFNARAMDAGRLTVARENCYGCGLCVDACPEGCISMEARQP